jgi:hypothetical protein
LKAKLMALSLRLGFAWFLLSMTVLSLFLVGAAQSFLDSTLKNLFFEVRLLSWCGLLGSGLFLVPFCWNQGRRLLAALAMALGFALLFSFVLYWGVWIYPDAGNWPW